jgi:ribonuclease HII
VILPVDRPDLADVLAGVNDSKKLTPERRAALAPLIKDVAISWGVGRATNAEIDELGIILATQTAMERALRKLIVPPDFLLIDALNLSQTVMDPAYQMNIIRGDQHSLSIAAASILAKVTRDEFMIALDDQYPEYGFAGNKGYGTALHKAGLARCGPCRAHRFSFKPVMNCRPLL